MIRTRDILTAYITVDTRLGERFDAARTADTRASWQGIRILNAHAYFMLVFGRFEKHVVDRSAALVAGKVGKPGWKRQRLWKDLQPRRLGFMQRIALLTNPTEARYGRIHEIYRHIRCPIAHGDNAAVGSIVLPVLVEELRRLSAQLKG